MFSLESSAIGSQGYVVVAIIVVVAMFDLGRALGLAIADRLFR